MALEPTDHRVSTPADLTNVYFSSNQVFHPSNDQTSILFEMEIFCNIINVFPFILDQLYVSLLNKSIILPPRFILALHFFFLKYIVQTQIVKIGLFGTFHPECIRFHS